MTLDILLLIYNFSLFITIMYLNMMPMNAHTHTRTHARMHAHTHIHTLPTIYPSLLYELVCPHILCPRHAIDIRTTCWDII